MEFPVGVMWADVLTKPLQGTAFRKMRAQLINCSMEYIYGIRGRISNKDTQNTD